MRTVNMSTETKIDPSTTTAEQLALHIYRAMSDGKVVTLKRLGNILFPTQDDKHRERRISESGKLKTAMRLLEPFMIIDRKGSYANSYHLRGWVTEPLIIDHLEGLT